MRAAWRVRRAGPRHRLRYGPTTLRDGRQAQDSEDELVAAVGRHSKFLWQISGPAYNDDAFLERAIARYGS